ncbi:QRFP-like peptide receptor like protein [Argiope bruennichi]|uniref:QRFP-like peptide receptor like protein n=1 Tax=Argiope bruennichi TaxID=94029 RepID=A0A8T0G1G5_ARGBR|nr:QRFP-like peptide receptor like protein [Argiope bruennichi]
MEALNSNNNTLTELVEEITLDESDQCDFQLNFSLYDFPNNASLTEPLDWEEYVKIVFYVIVLVIALMGNISVILTVALNRSMRTTINLYLVNLAVADLLICMCCMWVPLANSITKPLYSLGGFICKLNPFAQMTCLTASVLTLSAISCDRFIAIIFPLHVRITKQRTSVVISIIWLVSLAVAIPFLIIRKYKTYQINETNFHSLFPSALECTISRGPKLLMAFYIQEFFKENETEACYAEGRSLKAFVLTSIIVLYKYHISANFRSDDCDQNGMRRAVWIRSLLVTNASDGSVCRILALRQPVWGNHKATILSLTEPLIVEIL